MSDAASTQRYVILDLDKTLIYAQPIDPFLPMPTGEFADRVFRIKPIGLHIPMQVVKRKHVDKFLDDLEKRGFKIIVWSAGIDSYVKDIVSVLFKNRKLEYLLTVLHTTKLQLAPGEEPVDYKNLRVVEKYVPGCKLSNCKLVDDSDYQATNQKESFVLVKRFVYPGDLPTLGEDDEILMNLAEYIENSFHK